MALPSFLKRDRETELPPLPPTAIVERTNGKVELPDADRQRLDTIERAGIYAGEFRKELRELQIQLTENILKLESARRENGELRVNLAQAHNDRQALQSQIESQRQEISELRAAISTNYQIVVSFVSNLTLQLQRARIQLPPIWESLRQNQPTKDGVTNVSGPTPVDRPANATDTSPGPVDPAA